MIREQPRTDYWEKEDTSTLAYSRYEEKQNVQ
jgi:hypothetical protein